MPSRKRLLFVAAEAAFFVTHRLPLALAARDRGYEVIVATPPGRLSEVIQQSGLPWHEIAIRRTTNLFREGWALLDLYRLYRRLRPDLVHHVAMKVVLYGTFAARLARVPAVVNAVTGLGYSGDDRRAGSLFARAVRLAFTLLIKHPHMRVIFQNAEDLRVFVDRRWIAPDAAVLIRGSGVDTAAFAPSAQPREGVPLVVLASRLLKPKGVAEFVEAARLLRAAGVKARFAVVGAPDPDNPETITAAQLEQWNNEGEVEVWGRRSDMADVLREAAVFVLPTYYREGVPKDFIEAAAAGLPAVTTDTPGCRDIVLHGQTGLLVPPRDVPALAAALAELLDDPQRRADMGRRAREHVIANFSLGQVLDETLAVYERLVAGGVRA